MKYVILALSLVFISCASNKEKQQESTEKRVIPIQTLAKGVFSGGEGFEQSNTVIRSLLALKQFKNNMNIDVNNIDFSKEILVMCVDKVRRSGGYSIDIIAIEETDNQIVVSVKHSSPDPKSMVTMALTQPYHMITLPKRAKKVVFKVF